ncbi:MULTISPECIES: hypothetical protein [unclassified Streptomyces]|uniref:hypothetical protein n=1 Tax=unclassified Streptomyces TaxID=2593676 RepID=UPI0033FDF1BD
MNALELRTAIRNALTPKKPDPTIRRVDLVSPTPGEPVAMEVETYDPMGNMRRYLVTIQEI